MKVILLQDVPKVGHKYEVVNVANGYAQNHLFPQKLAEAASLERMAQLEAKRAEAEKQHHKEYEELKRVFAEVNGHSFIMTAKANEQGHLFQGIKAEDVANYIKEKTGAHIHPEEIDRQEPIKELGSFQLTIEHDDLLAHVTLTVEAEM